MGYSWRTLNYQKRIAPSNSTHIMSITDLIVIGVKTLRIDSGCSLEKEFTELICMNPWVLLYLIVNQVGSCYSCICGSLSWDTKDILWMDDHVLIMTYKSLATGSLKRYILDMTWSPHTWLCDQHEIIPLWYLKRLTHGMRCDEILG